MTLEELVSFCKNKDWDNLFPILSSSLKDLAIKILVTAVIETYHPDREIAHRSGLNSWSEKLSGNLLPEMSSLMSSTVDLSDFTRAFYTAKNALQNMTVANAIKTFVRKHKLILGQTLLRDAGIPDKFKQDIQEAFGDLRVSRYERETQARQQQMVFRKTMTEHLKGVDQVKDQLVTVLGLKARLFSVSFPAPEHPKTTSRGMFNRYPEINFDDSIRIEEFKAFENILATYGIKSRRYDMSIMHGKGAARGMQIFSGNAATIAQMLTCPPNESASIASDEEDNSPTMTR